VPGVLAAAALGAQLKGVAHTALSVGQHHLGGPHADRLVHEHLLPNHQRTRQAASAGREQRQQLGVVLVGSHQLDEPHFNLGTAHRICTEQVAAVVGRRAQRRDAAVGE